MLIKGSVQTNIVLNLLMVRSVITVIWVILILYINNNKIGYTLDTLNGTCRSCHVDT